MNHAERKAKWAQKTALVDAVAREVVKRNTSDIFLKQGLYLDKEALRRKAMDFNLEEFMTQQDHLHQASLNSTQEAED